MEELLAPNKKIPIISDIMVNEKIEIRIYNGDKDPTALNYKRMGVYLFINNNFIDSEWVECGKYIGKMLVNNPEITNEKREEMVNNAIQHMKDIAKQIESNWDEVKYLPVESQPLKIWDLI